MGEATVHRLTVGHGAAAREIAVRKRRGAAPGVLALTGYTGTMAAFDALDGLACDRGFALTRFDYSGHGASSGRFLDLTMTDWLDDAEAVLAETEGPQVVVGLSMGGWLALHLAQRNLSRVKALVLLAPAVDMTAMIFAGMSDSERAVLARTGGSPDPATTADPHAVVTRRLIEDGERYLLIGRGAVRVTCPVRILHGTADESVPHRWSLDLLPQFASADVQYTLSNAGDHGLARPREVDWLFATVAALRAS